MLNINHGTRSNDVKNMQHFILCKTNIRFSSEIIFVEYWGICYALLATYWNTHIAKINQWLFKLKINDIYFECLKGNSFWSYGSIKHHSWTN